MFCFVFYCKIQKSTKKEPLWNPFLEYHCPSSLSFPKHYYKAQLLWFHWCLIASPRKRHCQTVSGFSLFCYSLGIFSVSNCTDCTFIMSYVTPFTCLMLCVVKMTSSYNSSYMEVLSLYKKSCICQTGKFP